MPTTPSHEAQDAEAAARAVSGAVPPGETAEALDIAGDIDPGPGTGGKPAQQAQPKAEEPKPVPIAKSAFDSKRDEINARFRTARTQETEEARDEVSEFARSNGMPPEFQANAEPEELPPEEVHVEAEPEAVPEELPPADHKYTLKVHGKEIEVTLDELIAKAQIAAASDNLLDESKGKLKEVEALLADIRNRAAHPAQVVQHQPAPNQVPSPEQVQQPAADPNQVEQKSLIEAIQFGNPEEAEQLLQNTIAQRAAQLVDQRLLDTRIRDEGARAAKVLKDFEENHPDIAKDQRARAAIEVTVYEQQLEDLKALGLDPARIRPDGMAATPADIANAHRFYRVQGFNVRSPQQMLEHATSSYLEWKGIKPQPSPDAKPGAQPVVKLTPKVDVTVDRSARRQAIPQQPSRTAAPRPTAVPAANQPRDRSAIVAAEKARRAELRGQKLGI